MALDFYGIRSFDAEIRHGEQVLVADDQEKTEAGQQRNGTKDKTGPQKDGFYFGPNFKILPVGVCPEMKFVDLFVLEERRNVIAFLGLRWVA